MPKLFSRFNIIALSLYLLASAGLATYLSNRYVLQTLSQALPPASSIVKAGIKEPTDGAQSVVFAGGCFWGVQSVFQHTQGVISAVSGYAGGQEKDAQYAYVTTGSTGHAEAVQVVYDPKQISYEQLLRVYLTVAHDPTQRNAQYPDEGPQYRSAVFYANDYQRQLTERYIAQVDSLEVFTRPIVTQLTPLASTGFYPAEDEHQNFAAKNPNNAYIAQFDKPKLVTFKSLLPELFREKPVLL
ncbi:MAG: peptide-methionine (S)-S-oxide reductase MsrA [Rhodoferax sp.]|nr:peptide-methionine (S)-S-oxide reductase MsrA [Rhodoferax sp.]